MEPEADTDKEESEKSVEVDKTETLEDDDTRKTKDEDLIKVIRYLVAAGCDVNFPVRYILNLSTLINSSGITINVSTILFNYVMPIPSSI